MNDLLRNPQDPLHKTGPVAEKELLRAFGQLAHQFPRDVVINAALNLLITAVRQASETRRIAEKTFDSYTQRAKQILLERHYDNIGKRRNIYPYTQELEADIIDLKRK